jgi:hypothetical protein
MQNFHTTVTKRLLVPAGIGILTALALGYIIGMYTIPNRLLHPFAPTIPKEVHVHADFRMYINDERIRFTDAKYQSEVGRKLADYIHFHDGSDEVIHRHANGITLAAFFDSLGLKLTNTCVTLDTGTSYCRGDDGELMLIVNGLPVHDIEHYILADNDRILLYFGDPQNPHLTEYTHGVTDLACMYTGTCPERGTPPTEGCTLTCDTVDSEDAGHTHN